MVTYINSDQNMVVDALSRLPDTMDTRQEIMDMAAVFLIESDPKLIRRVKKGYQHDSWCKGPKEGSSG